jgi:hypothetical protein
MFLNEARLAAHQPPERGLDLRARQDAETDTYYMAMEYIDGCNLKRVIHAAPSAHAARLPRSPRGSSPTPAGLDFAHNLKGEGQPAAQHRAPRHLAREHPDHLQRPGEGGRLRHRQGAHSEGKTQHRAGQGEVRLHAARAGASASRSTGRADVWALGVTLYWLLTSSKPFRGENEMLAPRRSVGSRVAIGAAAVLTLAGVLWVGGRRPPDRAPEPRAEAATPPSPKPPAPTAETAKPDEAKPEVAKADPTRTETAPPEPVKQDPPTPDDATSPEAAVSPHPHPPPKAVAKRAPASGHIAVMVAPWAKVFVDGKEMGVTPFAPLEVKAGRHHLLLVNDEIRASREISVEVKSGRTATVRVNLE